METRALTSQLSVAPQITAADLETLALKGFKTIINNRPDGEAEGQPASADLAAEASRQGLVFIEIPVKSSGITNQNVSDFGEQLEAAETPVLAFCRTGTPVDYSVGAGCRDFTRCRPNHGCSQSCWL